MPTAIRAAPRTSRVPDRRRSERCASAVRASATIATGTLTQKTARQVQFVSQPPSSGPRAVRAPETPKNRARARPRRSTGNTATTTARAAGKSSAAPNPWVARNTIIQVCAALPSGTQPHSTDDTTNTSVPITTTRRGP